MHTGGLSNNLSFNMISGEIPKTHDTKKGYWFILVAVFYHPKRQPGWVNPALVFPGIFPCLVQRINRR
jgi:hypothetical protein